MMTPGTGKDQRYVRRNGSCLYYRSYGAKEGLPVMYFHGWPGSRLEGGLFHDVALKTGIQLIAVERPGYGRSDPVHAYALQAWVEDISGLADTLQWSRFRMLGMSGGGPYTCALMANLPDRIERTALVVPMGSLATSEGLRSMLPHQRLLVALARKSPSMARLALACGRWLVLGFPSLVTSLIHWSGLPNADKEVLKQLTDEGLFLDSMREALRQGVDGMFEDGMRFLTPWETDFSRIRCPVHIWHGEADRIVPLAFSKQIASQIKGCQSTWLPGEGHFSVPFGYAHTIFQFLAELES